MAVNIFDKYGIKEVANVYFEALEDDPKSNVYKGDIVLFLDTLKVSTIETTAETTDATGGWGNPKLISWDYGKEITITLEDALISLESLRFMLGGAIHKPAASDTVIVHHTEEVIAGEGGALPLPKDHITGNTIVPMATQDHPIRFINYGGGTGSTTAGVRTQVVYDTEAATYDSTSHSVKMQDKGVLTFKNSAMGVASAGAPAAQGDHVRIFWDEVITGAANADAAVEVTISPDTFPGTYRVVGDTFMRSQKTGKDEAFQFVIGKAKVQSEITLTLEAEGDPSTFEMTLNVLRDDNERGDKEMMKLIRYGGAAEDETSAGNDNGSLAAGGQG